MGYLYNQFAYWLFNYDLPKTIETEKLAMEFTKSQKQIDTFLLQKSAISLGFYYERNDQIKEALKVYKELILLKKPGRYETNCYGKLGYCYGLINDYHSAIDYYKVQISLLEENKNDQRRLMEAYLNTASYLIKLQEKKDLLQAEIYALKADSLAQIIPTRYESAYYIKLCLAQRFNQFVDLNIPKAEFYYNQAFTLADKANDIVGIQKVYYEKGALYNSTDPELSIAYYKKAQELSTGNDPHIDYLITSGLSTSWAYNH
ncbi:MAG: hypothetical protein K0U54_13395, partial [Bacteroidetes bacterium]|nr:hypothetical protein [Bacteroidota bacterium]